MSEFEKWAIEYDFEITLNKISSSTYKEYETHCAWLGWQAATAESDKCVRELTATIAELEASNELLHEALESNQISEKELLSYRNHINVLRENLDYAYYEVNTHFAKNIKDLLASTPAQSLQEHDNEVIERCAKVAMDWDITGIAIADAIRALKGK